MLKSYNYRFYLLLTLILVGLFIAGCGGKHNSSSDVSSPTATPSSSPMTSPTPNPLGEAFNLPLLPVETTPLVADNFTTNTTGNTFFSNSNYSAKWSAQNIANTDLSSGTVTADVSGGIVSTSATVSKTLQFENLYSPATANYSVSTVVKTTGGASAGVMARWIDKNNFYALRITSAGTLDLGNSKIANNTLTSLNTANGLGLTLAPAIPDFDQTQYYKVTMVVNTVGGNVVITGYVNNAQLLNVTISNAVGQLTQAGYPGMYATINNTTASFGQFKTYNITGN